MTRHSAKEPIPVSRSHWIPHWKYTDKPGVFEEVYVEVRPGDLVPQNHLPMEPWRTYWYEKGEANVS